MRLRRLLRSRWTLLALAAGALYLTQPLYQAERFRAPVTRLLERQFSRPVSFQEMHYSFLPVPALALSNAVLGEDPEFGAEPFAYVTTLEIVPSLKSLFAGEPLLAQVRLIEPSINLARGSSGEWNFQRLLLAAARSTTRSTAAPDLEIRDGRINFREGNLKSIFYLTAANLEISPAAASTDEEANWSIYFEAEPARSDRPAHGFGRFTGRGSWRVPQGGAPELRMNVALERGSLSDMLALASGRDLGLRGALRGIVDLRGSFSALRLAGEAEIVQLHRWDTLPGKGLGWKFPFRGEVDLISQRLSLRSDTDPDQPSSPLRFEIAAHRFLLEPSWSLRLQSPGLPLPLALAAASRLGLPLPEDLHSEGSLFLDVRYSSDDGWQGKIQLAQALVGDAGESAFAAEEIELLVERSRLRIPGAELRSRRGASLRLEGTWDWITQAMDFSVKADRLPVATLNDAVSRWAPHSPAPLLSAAAQGEWSGALRYQKPPSGVAHWQGAGELREATFPVEGFAAPVEIHAARVSLSDTARVLSAIEGRLASLPLRGVYRHLPRDVRPHQFTLLFTTLDATSLSAILAPVLGERRGLLPRTLGIGAPGQPAWLGKFRASGSFQAGALRLGGVTFHDVSARIFCYGAQVTLSQAAARLEGGQLVWDARIDFQQPLPRYRVSWKLENALWRGGLWHSEGTLETTGSLAGLWRNLSGQGAFCGDGAALVPGEDLLSLDGCFTLKPGARGPAVELDCLRVTAGGDSYIGTGELSSAGSLVLELRSPLGARRISGNLAMPAKRAPTFLPSLDEEGLR